MTDHRWFVSAPPAEVRHAVDDRVLEVGNPIPWAQSRQLVTDISERARNKERCNSTALICSNPATEGPSHVAPQKALMFHGRMCRCRHTTEGVLFDGSLCTRRLQDRLWGTRQQRRASCSCAPAELRAGAWPCGVPGLENRARQGGDPSQVCAPWSTPS